ncbi:MarR family winged helix-turn-helix transcriptional regulator [Mesorhizobium sp. CAU 1741]|uniref:MarR family winged helix-turn-helix transcriptional regulator n=1 Tax=Mesorhizobium sp. CAU 1741 TaxID=3140366 RepID=UPI00325B269E
MTTPSDDQIAMLANALDTFSRRYKLTDTGADRPLTELDNQVLLFVAGHPSCGPTDVARFLDVAATTISSATDRLVKRGLLNRQRLEGDRRAVALTLSEDGEAYVSTYKHAHDSLFRMMLERLLPEERETFLHLISKIAHHDD